MTTSSQSEAEAKSLDYKILAHHEQEIANLIDQLSKAPKSGHKRMLLRASLNAAEASRREVLADIEAKEQQTQAEADQVAFEPLFEPPDLDDPEWQATMDSLGGRSPEARAETSERDASQTPRDRANPACDGGAFEPPATETQPAEVDKRQAEIAATISPSDLTYSHLAQRVCQWVNATHRSDRELLERHGAYSGNLHRLTANQRRALLVEILVDLGRAPLPEPEPLPPPPKPRSRPRPASRIAESGPPRGDLIDAAVFTPGLWPGPQIPRRRRPAPFRHIRR